jgi:cell division protein FtsB
MVQELSMENNQLKDKVKYLEDKIKQLISEQIQFKRNCVAQQN